MHRPTLLVLAVVALVALTGVQGQDRPDLQLKAAVYKETVEGDLQGAIALYKQIVSNAAVSRPIAAAALLGLGGCYEKVGEAQAREARRAYERIVRELADQKDAVARARARLAAMGSSDELMRMRQIWADVADIAIAPTLDGRYLLVESSENLAVRELASGQTRRLTNKAAGSLEFFAMSAEPSPDGAQVAYAWYNADGFVDLRTIGFDGSNPRVLFADRGIKGQVYPDGWSPDGRSILATHYGKDGSRRLLVVSAVDGSVRVLNVKGNKPSRPRFSPDGRYIAYHFGEWGTLDIAVFAADGTRETPVVQHLANDVLFDWTPDGRGLLFGSDRTGAMGAWLIPIADGRAAGAPELVKPDLGQVRPIGFTRGGSFYYTVSTPLSDVYVAEIDVAAGRILAPPVLATDRYVGSNQYPAWSPDGRELVFLSARGPGYYGTKAICVRRTDNADVREIASGLKNIVGIHWFPDGRSLLTAAQVGGGEKPGVFRLDVRNGAFEAFDLTTPAPIGLTQGPAWSPDGRTLFYPRWGPDNTSLIVARDQATGQEKELHSVAEPAVFTSGLRMSPDGRHLAVAVRDKQGGSQSLMVVPTAGGAPREVLRSSQLAWPLSIAWAPDGKGLLFVKRPDARDTKTELWLTPLEGGEARSLGLTVDAMRDLCFHPDGRHIAYTRGANRSEMWVLENFLPAARGASPAQGVKK